ncbi:adenosylcobinamide-GDP ribazoletransferase [Pseudoalteromonas xiamenensis]
MNLNGLQFKLALVFLTRLPVKIHSEVEEESINLASGYFALVGLVIALMLSAAYLVIGYIFPAELTILLLLALSLMLTGAFHEDGFADVWDGFGGGWTQRQKLEIMKDSRLGTYGASALVILLLSKYISLYLLAFGFWQVVSALVLGHVLSRAFATALIGQLPYVQADAESKVKPVAKHLNPESAQLLWLTSAVVLLLTWMLTPLSFYGLCGLCLVLWGVQCLCKQWFKAQLQGYTGDCLGAAQQCLELTVYFYLVALLA